MLFKLLFLVIETELFMKYQIGTRLLEEEYLEFWVNLIYELVIKCYLFLY